MAGLNTGWEQIITEGIIYLIKRETGNYESIKPMLHIKGTGSVDILGSQEEPAGEGDMTLNTTDTNIVAGYKAFEVIPNYLLVRSNQAGSRTVILTGFVVPAYDENEWAKAMEKILKNPQSARLMGNSGKEILEKKYSIDIMKNKIFEMYNDLIKK